MEDVVEYTEKLLVMNQAKLFCYDDTPAVFRRTEELSGMGLRIPQIAGVMHTLRQRGYDLPEDIYTVAQARDALLGLLRKGGAASC
jgi:energy-coupling factor transport system ATP-binding protein